MLTCVSMRSKRAHTGGDPAASGVEELCLSRYLSIRPRGNGVVLESPLSGARLELTKPSLVGLLLSFMAPRSIEEVLAGVEEPKRRSVRDLLGRCRELRILSRLTEDGSLEEETEALGRWEYHDLLFHVRSRDGRNPEPVGALDPRIEDSGLEPAVKAGGGKDAIPLSKPDPEGGEGGDAAALSAVLERRRSLYSVEPLDLDAVGLFLYRTCRVTGLQETAAGETRALKVYPSGGALHPLETYLVPYRCRGLERGLYHYRPLDHALSTVHPFDAEVEALLRQAQVSTGKLRDYPSLLLVLSARFGRTAWKYRSITYRLILEEVGALYQTMYLVATDMGLAPCALGAGNSDRFSRLAGLDYFAETSVGELILGGPPRP